MGGRQVHQVVLHLHRGARGVVLLHAGAQAARGRVEQPVLAIAQQRQLRAGIAQMVLVVAPRRDRVERPQRRRRPSRENAG